MEQSKSISKCDKGSFIIQDHGFCYGPQVVILVGKDHKVKAVNSNVWKYNQLLFSGNVKEGAFIQDIIARECRDTFLEKLGKALKGQDIHSSIRLKMENGYQRWFDVYYKPVMLDEKTIIGVYVTFWPLYQNLQRLCEQEKYTEDSYYDLARAIIRTYECRDPNTAVHQKRVAAMAKIIGRRMGFDKDRLISLYLGGLLHDIGKLKVPTDILAKPSSLTPLEFELIKEHPVIGYNVIKDTMLPKLVGEIVYCHHERLDGSGYPDGVSGDNICQEVKIVTVCDVVDAMFSFRPYRPARTKDEVMEELNEGRDIKYDTQVVDAMLELLTENVSFHDLRETLFSS